MIALNYSQTYGSPINQHVVHFDIEKPENETKPILFNPVNKEPILYDPFGSEEQPNAPPPPPPPPSVTTTQFYDESDLTNEKMNEIINSVFDDLQPVVVKPVIIETSSYDFTNVSDM
jgi:hypothetical protein